MGHLIFEHAQMLGIHAKAGKNGLFVEVKIGARLTTLETEAMGLGEVVALHEDFESARPRFRTGKSDVLFTPEGLAEREIKWAVQEASKFAFTLDAEVEDWLWCEFILRSSGALEPLAVYWDVCGTASGSLTIQPLRTVEQVRIADEDNTTITLTGPEGKTLFEATSAGFKAAAKKGGKKAVKKKPSQKGLLEFSTKGPVQ